MLNHGYHYKEDAHIIPRTNLVVVWRVETWLKHTQNCLEFAEMLGNNPTWSAATRIRLLASHNSE